MTHEERMELAATIKKLDVLEVAGVLAYLEGCMDVLRQNSGFKPDESGEAFRKAVEAARFRTVAKATPA